jgi:16S rRNA G527 N7-methylase RsmG
MTPREFSERLARRTRKANVALDPVMADALAAYYHLLEVWNEKVNLTAFSLKDATDEAIDRLLVEPLVAARHLQGSHGHGRQHGPQLGPRPRMIDIGSGGGSPAIRLRSHVDPRRKPPQPAGGAAQDALARRWGLGARR